MFCKFKEKHQCCAGSDLQIPLLHHVKLLPRADGQYLQQPCGGHLQGRAELRHTRFLQELEGLPQHGLCTTELGKHIEQPTGDGQRHVHRLVANTQCKHSHQQEALLRFYSERRGGGEGKGSDRLSLVF